MHPVKTMLTVAVACLVLFSSGCLSDDEEPDIKVVLDLMAEEEQNVVQGNNTTFLFAVENNWKDIAVLVMSASNVPKDWEHSFVPESVEVKKHKGAAVASTSPSPRTR